MFPVHVLNVGYVPGTELVALQVCVYFVTLYTSPVNCGTSPNSERPPKGTGRDLTKHSCLRQVQRSQPSCEAVVIFCCPVGIQAVGIHEALSQGLP